MEIEKKQAQKIKSDPAFWHLIVMNPFPKMNHFKTPAPIPHQFAMKLHGDAWIYISEKFWNMGIMDKYGAILAYEKFGYLTIPNFIVMCSPFI